MGRPGNPGRYLTEWTNAALGGFNSNVYKAQNFRGSGRLATHLKGFCL